MIAKVRSPEREARALHRRRDRSGSLILLRFSFGFFAEIEQVSQSNRLVALQATLHWTYGARSSRRS